MQSGSKLWIVAAALVVGGFVAYGVMKSRQASPAPGHDPSPNATSPAPQAPGAIEISVASSNTKQEWLHAAVQAFNEASKSRAELQHKGQPIFVKVLQETVDGKSADYRSGTMVKDTLSGTIKPTVLSPGEESWLERFKGDWKLRYGSAVTDLDAPVVVRTPLVIAMWESRAKVLGCLPNPGPTCTWARIRALAQNADGWKSLGHPEWRRFTLGYGYFGESNSGTLAVVAMCMAGANKRAGLTAADVGPDTGCGKFVAGVDQAKFHSGKSDLWLLEKLVDGGPEYLDAVVTYESNVIATNRSQGSRLREPLVAVYPQDGTVVVGHPYAVLDKAPWVSADQAAAAGVFGRFLLSNEQQQAVLGSGLRPVDASVKLSSPIDPSLGANPEAKLVALEIPEPRLLEKLGEVWHRIKKHATIVLLFDKSGSMREGGKINAAVRGAQEFVKQMGGEDQLIWMPFDNQIYGAAARGAKSQIGEELIAQIAGTRAEGGTALYDAMEAAFSELTATREKSKDSMRYGIVLLSDGRDENSRSLLAQLEERLRPQESDPTGIQIHAIAIGSDADENVLRRIAAAAHGRYWKGKDEKDMVRIYKEISTYW
jgi:Ca-activated chloride channel family protein